MIFTDESMFKAVEMSSRGQWVADDEVPEPVRKDRWAAQARVWGAICADFKILVVLEGLVDASAHHGSRLIVSHLSAHRRIQVDCFSSKKSVLRVEIACETG